MNWHSSPLPHDDMDNGIREIYLRGLHPEPMMAEGMKSIVEQVEAEIADREAYICQIMDWNEADIALFERLYGAEGVINTPPVAE
jgi:hypothetical protein